ncbi:histidinol phosphate phosphatase hisN-like protein [Actinocorallia herbida]|uniref:Histidinol phosphate phosphatase hisN-like protein n=1 Tax=Actinocorallia herbida TaxID=58109 RepID=A0A3N1DA05_9ACTN|nr:phosphatase [Actinocorallia herbida]ROO90336.1 histidinol phosphate phosphatase hisN-like protein [Actinocorallia herbida]
MTGPGAPSRDELRAHLLRHYIAGDVATPRQNNLRHFRKMAEGDPYYQFGLDLGPWTYEETVAMMAGLAGTSPDLSHWYGDDTIDVERTLDALDAMGDRIGEAARAGSTVLLATGHPGALLDVLYVPLADALRAAGCTVPTPAEGWSYLSDEGRYGPEIRTIQYNKGVAALEGDDELRHTHHSAPMEAMLANLADESRYWPDLVIADHGWAGAAGEAGVSTVGFADCNDPALFAGHVLGKIEVCVPLDDFVLPRHYTPLTRYLMARADLSA